MKNFNIAFIVFALTLLSCSTEETEKNNNLLIGTWNVNQVTENGEENTISDCEFLDSREFNNNNSFNFQYFGPGGEECILEGDEQGTWSVENNVLVLKWDVFDEDDPEFSRWPILELTESTLRLKIEYPDEDFPEGWHQVVTYKKSLVND